MALLRSIATVGGFTLLSRILGFIRDILIAAFLGTGMLADVFFVAFKFPNLFRRLFAEGAFNAAFVPQFAGLLESDGKRAAQVFAEQALAVLLWSVLIFVVLIQIAMPYVMLGFAPGFADNPEQFNLAVLLTRITFPYLLFISLASLMSGVLNSLGKFAAAAATPILLNICLIGALTLLAGATETPAHALAWGVSIAGMVQFFWLLMHCGRSGIWLRLVRPRLTPNVRKMIRRILPVAIGAGVYQVSLLIDTIIASLLPAGSISYLFFADRVNQLPLGVVGVAVGTALLPLMSRQLGAEDEAAAMSSQNRAIEFSLFLTLPAAVALVVIAEPIVSVLFERGAFDATSVKATAGALSIYATGLPAYVLVKALAPGFFAREDTATPVKIAVFALAVNLVLNLALMGPFLHLGIAAATAVSAWCNALILGFVLHRRGHLVLDARILGRLPRMVLASLAMGAAVFYGAGALVNLLADGLTSKILAVAVLVIGGLIIYGVLSLVTGAANRDDIRRVLRR
ncbi:MAG: murein biosynthesis integral membrane protein MurJ [Rhodospirillaceae bacterium]|jgi:putative peptidoglycan lipid II flippase|nr:murein biosynthesis integral membrane protein MurJ [Rhodospirillaceae bacterium]MBT4590313.1 murein biosynthesis integral membrane protein MurJ [Rhodospirillaceae bacterium]MBT5938920.1 murein biosynthesis integral membrane protein MurJ [Rhodospirillaceae bacterium]MBT7268929.1 murein biosynthesis integral membrane protein MurJ [Rhodospirillaceae bacterium]